MSSYSFDIQVPCTLTIYKDGCARVDADCYWTSNIEDDPIFIPRIEVTRVIDGGEDPHDHGITGVHGAYSSLGRFLINCGYLEMGYSGEINGEAR